MDEARQRAQVAMHAIGLDLDEQRLQFTGAPGFRALFPLVNQSPNAIQRAAAEGTSADERLVIVESETGSGKTEAALWRFARMYEERLVDGLYFALPHSGRRRADTPANRGVRRISGSGPAEAPGCAGCPRLRAGRKTQRKRRCRGTGSGGTATTTTNAPGHLRTRNAIWRRRSPSGPWTKR